MIIHNNSINAYINPVTQYFTNYVSKCNLTDFYNLNVSDNIDKDYLLYDIKLPKTTRKTAAVTILPALPNRVIQILISSTNVRPDTILHELTHMYDFVLFSNTFCNNELQKVKPHKFFNILFSWTEFHARIIEIVHTQIFLDMFSNKPILVDFTKNIKTFYYPEYTKKFRSKQDIHIRDIMWYFAELTVCNLYDKTHDYIIPEDMVDKY